MCPPWHTWDRKKAAERPRQSGRVAGSFAVRVGDPGAAAATAASSSAREISAIEPRTAAAEAAAAVLGELEPAPGPLQVPPLTPEDAATGESGAGGPDGALSGVCVTCVPISADAGDVATA